MGASSGMTATELVEQWLRCNNAEHLESARPLLADDLEFDDPMDKLHSADEFLAAMRQLWESGILHGFTGTQIIGDGSRAALFSTMETAVGPIPVAQSFSVADGRITAIRTYFDPRPLSAPAAG